MQAEYFVNISSKKIKYGLERTLKMIKRCGLPKNNFFKIQIIGTNGKGSVAAFLTNILYNAGYKVGTYTSPHLLAINERIKVNKIKISDKEIKSFISKYKNEIELIEPSFFEIMTTLALKHFSNQRVDIAILETGLGGRLDSVTACQADMLLFTSISMDHHEILGPTLRKISFEKAHAIISSKQILLSVNQSSITTKELQKQARLYNNNIDFLNSNALIPFDMKFLKGLHQQENANLAYRAIQKLKQKKIINVSIQKSKKSISNTAWNGRFQIIYQKPTIIYDVAHNKSSLATFLKTYKHFIDKEKYKNKHLICAFEENKKIQSSLKKFKSYFDYIICTETGIRKSMKAKNIAKIFTEHSNVMVNTNIEDVIKKTKKEVYINDLIVIIGSHYIAPAIHKNFKNCFVDS